MDIVLPCRSLFVRPYQPSPFDDPKTCAGVPQGSVLSSILFSLYISPIAAFSRSHGIRQQLYADDTQLFIEVSSSDCEAGLLRLEECITNLHHWFCINGLVLNPDKTDAVFLGTHRRSKSHTTIDSINVSGVAIQPSNQVNLLGVVLDETLMLTAHVGALCKTNYFHIPALRHIRKTLSIDDAKTVASALIGFRLDYANSVLYAVSAANISKQQRI